MPAPDEEENAVCFPSDNVAGDVASGRGIAILSSRGLYSAVNDPQREANIDWVAFNLPKKLKFMPKDTLK